MATTLQRQLAAISAKSTNQLNLKAQKQRHAKSLIFEPHEAAKQSFDTLYQICADGFDDLCQLDARFRPFAKTLFAPSSVEEEREHLTQANNDQLNIVVEQFLALVCARLLLRPAQKSVEWLVRRWRAHEYNASALLYAFLPYHTHHLFPTVFSIVADQLSPEWSFLRPYKAALQCPPRHALVAAAIGTPAFTTGFSKFILDAAKRGHYSSAVIGFWASLMAQAINGMLDSSQSGRSAVRKQRIEDVLTRILPILQAALSVTGVDELYLASCTIISLIATKAHLDDKVLDAMMEALATTWTRTTFEDGVPCLAQLAEDKVEMSTSKAVVSALAGNDRSADILRQTSEKCRVSRLTLLVALGYLKSPRKKASPAVVAAICRYESLTTGDRTTLLQELLAHEASDSQPGSLRDVRRELLRQLGADRDWLDDIKSAARKANIDVVALGFEVGSSEKALFVIPAPEAIQRSASDSKLGFEEVFSNLPAMADAIVSFLAPGHVSVTLPLVNALEAAIGDKSYLHRLYALPSLHKTHCTTRPVYLSFLANTWSTSNISAVRAEALQEATKTLAAGDVDTNFDYQNLLPAALAALGDVAKPVRRAASVLTQQLYKQYGGKLGKTPQTLTALWWKTAFPASEASSFALKQQDVWKFLSVAVVSLLEECVLDPAFISRSLTEQLNGSILKIPLRTDLCTFLTAHAFATGNASIQTFLRQILARTGKAAGHARTKVAVVHLKAIATSKASPSDVALYNNLLPMLSHRTTEETDVLQQLLVSGDQTLAVPAIAHLKTLFKAIKPQAQLSLADILLDLSVNGDNVSSSRDTSKLAHETLRDVRLQGDILAHMLDKLPTAASLTESDRPSKKRRTSKTLSENVSPVDPMILADALRRVTTVLELIESTTVDKNAKLYPQLLQGLFHQLSEMHKWRAVADSDLVYIQTLLLGNLLAVITPFDAKSAAEINRTTIRADLIVEALRVTNSPQVHNTALLLISKLATIVPDSVLHSVMPLFTFMSSNTLRQADQYSSHVMSMTVESIVPPLAASLRKKGQNLVAGTAELLLSFTAAFEHMPLHRRLGTFKMLIETLGSNEVLSALVAMLTERYSGDSTLSAFIRQLCNSFSVRTQLLAIDQYMELVLDASKPKPALAGIILGYNEKNAEEKAESIETLLNGLQPMLSNTSLQKKLSVELQKGGGPAQALRTTYGQILERLVALPRTPITKGSVDLSTPVIKQVTTGLLGALLGLMPTEDFITSSAALMQIGSEQTRCQVFASLTTRVQGARQGDTALRRVFIEALPNCTAFLIPSQPVSVRHAALECLDGIVEQYGKVERDACAAVVDAVVGKAALQSEDESLRTTSLLTLATMVESIGEVMIGAVPQVLDLALAYLERHRSAHQSDIPTISDGVYAATRDAVFSFINALLDHMPFVLTTSTLSAAMLSGAQDVAICTADDLPWTLTQFATLSARKLDLPILLRALSSVLDTVATSMVDYASAYVAGIFQQAIAFHTKASISKNARAIFALLLQVFDVQRQAPAVGSEAVLDSTASDLAASVAMDITLKLNDTTLRPFFSQLMAWITDELPQADILGRQHRGIVTMTFAARLFEQLGSIVTSYGDYIVEYAVSIMQSAGQANPENAEGAQALLAVTLKALEANFRHDQDDFYSAPHRFEAIRASLIALASAVASSNAHLKTLNSALLLLFRHTAAEVRLRAVQVERAITEKLTFDWLNLLPEMLPAISEALEDDDERVEREVGKWVEEIEGVTGEGLEGMLA
ncbi:snoRNA-binding rRNA-processing protein utp10 [Oleoguttula sp. CCFEE 5521]